MSRQFKIILVFLFVGVVVLGTIFAQKKPPAEIPLAVTIYDTYTVGTTEAKCMWRSDTGGEYINGVDSVTATVNTQYGELYFEVPRTSPRRALFEFDKNTKETCPNECLDRNGNPISPPGLGEVNSVIFTTYNRSAWACETRFNIDCTQDYLHMIPGSTGHTNLRLQILSPIFSSPYGAIWIDYSRACENLTQIGYVFFAAGQDHNGDGYADEWDLYPVPLGYPFSGDRAHVWLLQGGGKKCDFGRYELPFKIHLRKI